MRYIAIKFVTKSTPKLPIFAPYNNQHVRHSLFLLLFFPFFSCSDDAPKVDPKLAPFGYPVAEVLQHDTGLFRGVQLGMKTDEVLKLIGKTNLTEQQPDYLFYEDSLSGKAGFTYEFSFSTDGLFEMHVDIYGRDSTNAQLMTKRFENYFTKKYGEPDYFNDLLIWYVKSGKGTAQLELSDQSDEYAYGKIAISVYDKAFAQPMFHDSLTGDSLQLQ